MTYRQLFEEGKTALLAAEIPDAQYDARVLLEHVCDTDRTYMLLHGNEPVEEEKKALYLDTISRRVSHIPLQHILGTADFMGLTFQVNEDVLCPRQDTEILVEEMQQYVHDGMRILDMCTGSGCILLSLLKYSNDCQGVGVDLSTKALAVANRNAQNLELSDRASFLHSDLFEKVTGKYEILVSNPPYIRTKEIENLMPEVKDHEPLMALDGMEDGLFFYREIVKKAPEYLTGGGMLFFEIGYDQGEAVQKLMEDAGFTHVTIKKDYAGLDRVVFGTGL